ncbi:hypothetical protein N6H05_07550 [Sphingobium sp. WTD-1]|uniref:hypothetical protein n=1 Tax=Sphingobium sp. WTD-1 TaxID=2979467 RepID=UPI0024DE2E21|nr:hypothetical protein [Sphingobium sp. WTD-1]WIA57643.1 hypothetical protein N6H05_07550 [Sphingobium sp. WTD-1]
MSTFNPTAWVQSFISVGGTIMLSADGVRVGYAPENEAATEAVKSIGRDPGNWNAVKSALGAFVGETEA